MKTVAIASLKGGVGKTTTAIYLSYAFSQQGLRVLAVDADPNNNLTDFFFREEALERIELANLYHVLTGKLALAEACHRVDLFDLSVLPCTPLLHRVGDELEAKQAVMLRFASDLRSMPHDVVLIDSPPALVFEFRAAIRAADTIVAPVNASRWTLGTLSILQDELALAGEETDRPSQMLCVPMIVTEREADLLRSVVPGLSATAITKWSGRKGIDSLAGQWSKLEKKQNTWNQFRQLAREVL